MASMMSGVSSAVGYPAVTYVTRADWIYVSRYLCSVQLNAYSLLFLALGKGAFNCLHVECNSSVAGTN